MDYGKMALAKLEELNQKMRRYYKKMSDNNLNTICFNIDVSDNEFMSHIVFSDNLSLSVALTSVTTPSVSVLIDDETVGSVQSTQEVIIKPIVEGGNHIIKFASTGGLKICARLTATNLTVI